MATLQATTVSGNFSCTTLTGGTLASAVAFPAGHMIQCPTQNQAINETSVQTSPHNTFVNTVIAHSITPLFNNSRVLLMCGFGVNLNNTTQDGGCGIQFTRTGGASGEPTSVSSSYADNRHSTFYRGGNMSQAGAAWYQFQNFNAIDSPTTTSSVTYTMRAATYNAEACQVGGCYQSRWFINLFEIKG